MATVNGTPLALPPVSQPEPPPGYSFVDCIGTITGAVVSKDGIPVMQVTLVVPNYIQIPKVLAANGAPSLDCHPHVGVRLCVHKKHILKGPESDV